MHVSTTTTLSPRYQIVIPKPIRDQMAFQPGQKFEVMSYKGRLELVPIIPLAQMRGKYAGIANDFKREKRDRL